MGRRHQTAFTLIELMIVIVILGVIITIALPNFLSSRLAANEAAAIATLRELVSTQGQFQTRGAADVDFDGLGEMGTFAELSGAVGVRGGSALSPTVLSAGFRTVNANGEVVKSGYHFRMFLPDVNGRGLGEQAGGGAPAGVDPDLAETSWCCYAWPTNFDQTGVRTFFVNQGGDVVATEHFLYSGPGANPDPGAALEAPGPVDSITGVVASGVTGRDGRFWRQVVR